MSDLREVLQENSYLRQKQLIFADCDRYQRARVSTLLSIAAAVAGADYDARRKNLKLTEKAQHLSQEIQAGITEFEAVLTAGFAEEERRELLRLIRKVEANVDAASDGKSSQKGEKLC